jgi:hypothetical protein
MFAIPENIIGQDEIVEFGTIIGQENEFVTIRM